VVASISLFVIAVAINIVVFLVLLSAVLAVFRIEKRTRGMDLGLSALHEELQQVKQELLRARREGNQSAAANTPPSVGDASQETPSK
jgi:hypothetical protein